MNQNEVENELKHWGILGMKWGIRNYQNPDGSLTPLGRIRYGVGAKKEITGNIAGVNDANSLSDEELKRMTRRYQQQADYYQARNNYINQERYFKQNVAGPKKEKRESSIGRFAKNVIGAPLERFLGKNSDFLLSFLGYKGVEAALGPEMAAQYLSSATGLKMDTTDLKQKKINELKKEAALNEALETIEKQERRKNDPNYEAYEKAAQQAKYWENMLNIQKNKQTYKDIESGEYSKKREREELTREYQAQNKFDAAKHKWEENRERELKELQNIKNDIANGFKSRYDENADEYVFQFCDPDDFNPKEKDNQGFNFNEFEFFKDAYSEVDRIPKKKDT